MKNNVRSIVICAVLTVCFISVTLLIPFQKTSAFWVSFTAGILAIAVQFFVMNTAFNNGESLKSKFYGFPIAKLSVTYLAVQIIASLGLMAVGFVVKVPIFAALLLCILIFVVFALGFIAVDTARDIVVGQDEKLKQRLNVMHNIQAKAETIADNCADEETEKKLIDLAEKIRFSDPLSSDALSSVENELSECVNQLENMLLQGDFQSADKLIAKTQAKLAERNRLCKLNK